VNNYDVLQTVKEEKFTLFTIKRRKANWIGHILCIKCLLKHVTEGEIKGKGRRGRRRKQILVGLQESRR
jgi:hypothetical protein